MSFGVTCALVSVVLGTGDADPVPGGLVGAADDVDAEVPVERADGVDSVVSAAVHPAAKPRAATATAVRRATLAMRRIPFVPLRAICP